MKFYGMGSVWDAENNKCLCRFNKHGEFETEDERTINILISLGFKHDEVKSEAIDVDFEEIIEESEELPFEPIDYSEMTNRELRELLEKEGHTGLDRKNKKQLLKLLEGE